MAYKVDIPPSVKQYFRGLSLSRTVVVKLFACIHSVIAETSDAYRADPANRPTPGQPYLLYQHVIMDEDRPLHLFDFIVSDAHAAYGVLGIVYAEHTAGGVL